MEDKLVPVFYDNELIPNEKLRVIKLSSSNMWFLDYKTLLALQINLPNIVPNYKGINHTNTFSDKVCIYSK